MIQWLHTGCVSESVLRYYWLPISYFSRPWGFQTYLTTYLSFTMGQSYYKSRRFTGMKINIVLHQSHKVYWATRQSWVWPEFEWTTTEPSEYCVAYKTSQLRGLSTQEIVLCNPRIFTSMHSPVLHSIHSASQLYTSLTYHWFYVERC